LQASSGQNGSVNYFFSSGTVQSSNQPLTVQYELEFSDQPFAPGNTTHIYKAGTIVANVLTAQHIAADLWPAATETTNAPSWATNSATIYWRVGAKNIIDSPGPLPDIATSERYIFSPYQVIQKPNVPPGPAVVHKGSKIKPKGKS
jgi:hypothetical protein